MSKVGFSCFSTFDQLMDKGTINAGVSNLFTCYTTTSYQLISITTYGKF